MGVEWSVSEEKGKQGLFVEKAKWTTGMRERNGIAGGKPTGLIPGKDSSAMRSNANGIVGRKKQKKVSQIRTKRHHKSKDKWLLPCCVFGLFWMLQQFAVCGCLKKRVSFLECLTLLFRAALVSCFHSEHGNQSDLDSMLISEAYASASLSCRSVVLSVSSAPVCLPLSCRSCPVPSLSVPRSPSASMASPPSSVGCARCKSSTSVLSSLS